MCDVKVIFTILQIDIKQFNKRNHYLFLGIEIAIDFQR